MKILFMGTPDFAVSSLKALVESGENVIGVVTQPDKMQGRGYKLTPSAVKVSAESYGIPVYTPNTLRGDEFASLLSQLDPELLVVAAYGKILPPNVISYPKLGCINVHGSLLPEYRGAAPMQRAIIDGKKITGITTMMMDDGLDTGDMLLKCEVSIEKEDNFETIHDKMAEAGAELLLDTIASLRAGTLQRHPQSESNVEPTYAAKIEKKDCVIDFTQNANTIYDLIRGLSPIPLALTHTPDGKLLKVISSVMGSSVSVGSREGGEPDVLDISTAPPDSEKKPDTNDSNSKTLPGTVVALDDGITVACGKDGGERITFTKVLPEGKGRMNATDFIRGRKIAIGDKLF